MLTSWQEQLCRQYVSRFRAGQLGHAQLLYGPAMLGKLALAQQIAKRFLCLQAKDDINACGLCVSCQRYEQGTHGDFKMLSLEVNEKTGKLRTEITVDQIRALNEWLSLTTQLGQAQIAIIQDAHLLNRNAANALLKSLEEPNANRYVFLVTDQPFALPATIRSRCQRMQMAMPDTDTALAFLKNHGLSGTQASELLKLTDGNPGLALAWHHLGGMAIYQQVHEDLKACVRNQAGASELSRRWLADEHVALRLNFAVRIGYGAAKKKAFAIDTLSSSTQTLAKLQEWIDAMNHLRLSLSQPLRHDLSLAGLFYDWQQIFIETR